MGIMVNIFGIIAFIIAVLGVVLSSEATIGVALIAFACFLGIVLRISQAQSNHAELKKLMEESNKKP